MSKYVKVEGRTPDKTEPDKPETSPTASFAQKGKGFSGLQEDYKRVVQLHISSHFQCSGPLGVSKNKQIKIEGSSITSHMLISTLLFATRLRLCLCVYKSIFSAMVAVAEYNGCGWFATKFHSKSDY